MISILIQVKSALYQQEKIVLKNFAQINPKLKLYFHV